MFRHVRTLSAQSTPTPSQDVPEIEPFDEDEFDTQFARLLQPDPTDDDNEDDA